jgi:hypothetical protein
MISSVVPVFSPETLLSLNGTGKQHFISVTRANIEISRKVIPSLWTIHVTWVHLRGIVSASLATEYDGQVYVAEGRHGRQHHRKILTEQLSFHNSLVCICQAQRPYFC